MDVTLRPLRADDADSLFEWMRDPESVRMAAFTAEDPEDRAAFDGWLARVLARDDLRRRMIEADGVLVGSISSFAIEGDREVSYWIDRAHWGRGIATAALAAFLAEEPERPLFARTASHNLASSHTLARNGFVVVGSDRGYANGVGEEIDELIHRLDA